MINDNPNAGDEAVLLFLFCCKFFPFGFLLRLKCFYPLWFIPLQASVFIETDVGGVCGVFFITNLFIMTSAFIGLAQIIDCVRREATKNDILDCVGFFATVIFFLLFCITRALAWPFCAIYPIGCFSFRLENRGELLGITFRDIPTMVQCLLQDLTEDMNPLIGCTWYQTKLKGENFLQGIDFHII